MSIRDTALNQTLRTETISIPEWDTTIVVREMTAAQRAKFITANRDPDNLYADIAILCVYDPDTDTPVFDPADRDQLAAGPSGVLERIFEAVAELSAAHTDAASEAEQVLDADPLDGSSSG